VRASDPGLVIVETKWVGVLSILVFTTLVLIVHLYYRR